jgi:DNA-binding GntR family transcriptional regulator
MTSRVTTAPPLTEQIYELLIDDICSGVIAGGEQLRQEAIAARYGVSRHPVQQAFVLLKRHGWVREAGKRGLEVVPMDAAYVNHLYDMRELLDVYAVRRSATEADRHDRREKLADIIRRGKAAATTRNFADLVTADADFHTFFYERTANPFLIDTAVLLSQSIRRVMTEVLARGGVPSWVWEEHERIGDAVLSGDAEAAAEYARNHVEHGRTMILENLAAGKPAA